jgi:hypothetical protein
LPPARRIRQRCAAPASDRPRFGLSRRRAVAIPLR